MKQGWRLPMHQSFPLVHSADAVTSLTIRRAQGKTQHVLLPTYSLLLLGRLLPRADYDGTWYTNIDTDEEVTGDGHHTFHDVRTWNFPERVNVRTPLYGLYFSLKTCNDVMERPETDAIGTCAQGTSPNTTHSATRER